MKQSAFKDEEAKLHHLRGNEKEDDRKLEKARVHFGPARFSISGHMLAHVLQTASEILPNTPYVSSNLPIAYFSVSKQNCMSLYWVSELKNRNTAAKTLTLIQCSYGETSSASFLIRNASHSSKTL